jgi:DNA-binding transcriptional ArsR family regulator
VPGDRDPAETDPVDRRPVDTDPADQHPVDTDPVDRRPVDTDPVDRRPVDTDPVDQHPVDKVLSALADPMRRRVLDLLAALGETTATVLAADLPVSRQAVVQHLAVLEHVELVASHRAGRERRYVVRPEPLSATASWMNQVAAQWDARLAIIGQLAESPEVPD